VIYILKNTYSNILIVKTNIISFYFLNWLLFFWKNINFD
jgi:hypothetical protein